MTRTATIEHRLTNAARGTWRIDPAHSSATFSVRHLMSRVRGRFGDLDGRVVIGAGLDSCSVAVAIPARTVDTGVPMRDDDLRSASFLDVATFESMTFESSEVHDNDDGLLAVGDLTIRGVTRPVTLQAEYLGRDDTGLQGEPRVGFSALTTILRSDFGVGENSAKGSKVVVGDIVTIELDVEAFLED
jgi:polyisoprenoid-binding protein YceI